MKRILFGSLLSSLLWISTIGLAIPAAAAALPEGAAYKLKKVADGFTKPLLITYAGDEPSRLFVVQQTGEIYIVENGQKLSSPFLDVSALVARGGMEQGLLGLAFHPQYAKNGYFYVNYTDQRGDTAVARYQVARDNPRRADSASGKIILQVAQPFRNHNGGHLAFGKDGYLYVGVGDGGSAGDPHGNGQKLDTLLGKLLRLDVDRQGVSSESGYAIPPNNPYANAPHARAEIWASGLRNPWRFSFDRDTGDLYIADVGQNQYEEINFQPAKSAGGQNYGWNFREGSHAFHGTAPVGLTDPILEYAHDEGACSVTGGYVYRGQALPALQGLYLFGDFCTGVVWVASRGQAGAAMSKFMETGLAISSFGEDAAGELYIADHTKGAIYRLEAAPR